MSGCPWDDPLSISSSKLPRVQVRWLLRNPSWGQSDRGQRRPKWWVNSFAVDRHRLPPWPWSSHKHRFSLQNQQVFTTTVTQPWSDLKSCKDNYLAKFFLSIGPVVSSLGIFFLLTALWSCYVTSIWTESLAENVNFANWQCSLDHPYHVNPDEVLLCFRCCY